MTLFSNGNNAIFHRRGGTNWGLYVTGDAIPTVLSPTYTLNPGLLTRMTPGTFPPFSTISRHPSYVFTTQPPAAKYYLGEQPASGTYALPRGGPVRC